MTTETIEQAPVEAAAATVTFIAKGRELRLVRIPEQGYHAGHGDSVAWVKTGDAVRHEFGPHGILKLEPGQHVYPTGPRGEDGEPTPEDAIDWLRRHTQLNNLFWEEGREPGRLLPTEDELLEKILTATMSLDAPAVEAVLEEEKRTHNRDLILRAGASALEKIAAVAGVEAEAAELGPPAPSGLPVEEAGPGDVAPPAEQSATAPALGAPPRLTG